MDVIKTKIGDIEVLIQSCDEKPEAGDDESSLDALSDIIDFDIGDIGLEQPDGSGYLTEALPDTLSHISVPRVHGIRPKASSPKKSIRTKVETAADDAFEKAKKLIFNMAEACGKEMEERSNKPDEFTLDFSLSFSVKSKQWILGFENNAVLKVGMKWNCGDCENNDKVV